MQGITEFLPDITKSKTAEETKIDFEFQQLGIEMMQHFGKQYSNRIWPLFHKAQYHISVIRDAWFIYQKTGKNSFLYFLGILNNKAGIKKLIKNNV